MLDIFISGRKAGKTTKAIEWLKREIAAGSDPVLVVRNQEDVHRLSQQYGLLPRYFASVGAVRGHSNVLAGRYSPVGIDAEIRLGDLLQAYLGTNNPIEFVALAEPSARVDAPAFDWDDDHCQEEDA